MKEEKKVYETPKITKVEFDASDRITGSACQPIGDHADANACALR